MMNREILDNGPEWYCIMEKGIIENKARRHASSYKNLEVVK